MADAEKVVVYGWELWSPGEGTFSIIAGTGFYVYAHERPEREPKYAYRPMDSLDSALEYARDYTNQLGKNNYQVLRSATPYQVSTGLLDGLMSHATILTLVAYLRIASDRDGTKQKVRRPRRKR